LGRTFIICLGALIAAVFCTGSVLATKGTDPGEGQTIYVPIYSHVYAGPKSHPINLTALLSIRNTDPVHPITIASVKYYDSGGKLIKVYLDKPMLLQRLGTTHFIVQEKDTSGGSGANFLVTIQAKQEAADPIVEAVHISTRSGLGISFVTEGKVIKPATGTSTK